MVENNVNKCPICGKEVQGIYRQNNKEVYNYTCRVCGKYSISGQFFTIGGPYECDIIDFDGKNHILSGIIRNAQINGSYITITTHNWKNLIKSAAIPESPLEKIDKILLYLSEKSGSAAKLIPIYTYDYPLFYCVDTKEQNYLLEQAEKEGYIERGRISSELFSFRLTIKGLRRINEISIQKQKTMAIKEKESNVTPIVFISYSWDSDSHKLWVKELATKLRCDGIDARLDQWETVPGDQLPAFMENAKTDSDFVLIICTPKYKIKSEKRIGGVGYEGDIITADVLYHKNHRKFIPILREGDWDEAAPSWLKGKKYIDMRSEKISMDKYNELLKTLYNENEKAPPLGSKPNLNFKTDVNDIKNYFTSPPNAEKKNPMEFFSQPISRETVKAYTLWKFPGLPINENIQELLINDIDHARFKVLQDIDVIVNLAKEAVNAYKMEEPKLFTAGTDYITKSLGFMDEHFREKHRFSSRTRQAFSKFEHLIKMKFE